MPIDVHGCPACPHPAIGPAIAGSPDVNVNKRPALRVDDPGIHAACCGPNTWTATRGSLTVFINGKGAHRLGDQNRHCGGIGQLVEGSTNVIVGEDGGVGGGGGSSAAGGHGGSRDGGNASGGGGNANHGNGTDGNGTDGNGTDGNGTDGNGTDGGSGASPGPDVPIEPDQIQVRLVDATGAVIQRAVTYQLTLPDGSTRTGQTDATGVLKLTGLTQRGDCTITLPELDTPT